MRMPTLETERLTIRPLKLSDLNACHQLLDIEDGGDGSLEERERWLRWAVLSEQQLAVLMQPPYGDRAMVVKNGGRMVGIAGLVPCILPLPRVADPGPTDYVKRHAPEVGLYYRVATSERNNGYAAEAASALVEWALAELHLERVIAMTTYDNAPSRRVMERLGMRIETNPNSEPPWLQVVGIKDSTPGHDGAGR